jgi:hypothetical protein
MKIFLTPKDYAEVSWKSRYSKIRGFGSWARADGGKHVAVGWLRQPMDYSKGNLMSDRLSSNPFNPNNESNAVQNYYLKAHHRLRWFR